MSYSISYFLLNCTVVVFLYRVGTINYSFSTINSPKGLKFE